MASNETLRDDVHPPRKPSVGFDALDDEDVRALRARWHETDQPVSNFPEGSGDVNMISRSLEDLTPTIIAEEEDGSSGDIFGEGEAPSTTTRSVDSSIPTALPR